MKKIIIFSLLILFLNACGGSGSSSDDSVSSSSSNGSNSASNSNTVSTPVTSGSWYKPSLMVTWQWQLMGTINQSYNVEIYDVDLFDTSTTVIQQLQMSGKKVICYFSGGSYEDWRPDESDFPASIRGNNLDGWPGERWLDVRAAETRTVMSARLDLAVAKGCDGVEPDNMDGYSNNPGFPLTAADQLDYNRFIANEAHTRNLSVALKNDLDQVADLVEYFDFAINEECFAYNECDMLQPFIDAGKPVLNAEYSVSNRNSLCTDSINLQFSTLILPLDLDDSSRDSCL